MAAEYLSTLDAALLSLETEAQQLNILAVLIIEPDPDIAREDYYRVARDRIESRLPLVSMLCRRLQTLPGFSNPIWEDEPDLAVDTHLHQALLAPPKDLRELGRIAGDIASRPLRRDRPLWEMWLTDELEDGRIAVICKVHHAVLDGSSGVGSLAGFFDLEAHAPPVVVPPRPEPHSLTIAEQARESIRGSVRWVRDFARSAPRVASMLVRAAQRVGDADLALPLTGPRLAFNRALDAAAHGRVHFSGALPSEGDPAGVRRDAERLAHRGLCRRLAAVPHGSRRAAGPSSGRGDPGLRAHAR